MILYIDTSVLVKRYVVETGSNEVNALIEQAETVGSVMLTRVEMASALAKAARMDWVENEEAGNAWQDFLAHWQSFARLSIPLLWWSVRRAWLGKMVCVGTLLLTLPQLCFGRRL